MGGTCITPTTDADEDLGTCPYFAACHGLPGADRLGENGPGTCAFGCVDEPACVTCEPAEGWPRFPRATEAPLPHGRCWGCGSFAAGRMFVVAELCARCLFGPPWGPPNVSHPRGTFTPAPHPEEPQP